MITIFFDGVNNSNIRYDRLLENIIIASEFHNYGSIFGEVTNCGVGISTLDSDKYYEWVYGYSLGAEYLNGSAFLRKVIDFDNMMHNSNPQIVDALHDFNDGNRYTPNALRSFYSEALDLFIAKLMPYMSIIVDDFKTTKTPIRIDVDTNYVDSCGLVVIINGGNK